MRVRAIESQNVFYYKRLFIQFTKIYSFEIGFNHGTVIRSIGILYV